MGVVVWGIVVVVGGVAVVASVFWRRRIRSRRPLTVEEKLLAARKASAVMRRSNPRANRDVFDRGSGVGDQYSAAILENSFYGDMSSDSGGGCDSGGGDGGCGGD